jgi:hypothetical protein
MAQMPETINLNGVKLIDYVDIDKIETVYICGHRYTLTFTEDPAIMEGKDATVNTTTEQIFIRKTLPLNRMQAVLFHEIVHAITEILNVKEDGKEFSEAETNRMSEGLFSLGFEYKK